MSQSTPQLSETLRSARRLIEDFTSLRLVQDLSYSAKVKAWTMCVSVHREASEHIPKESHWWFIINVRYPWGKIEVYPDRIRGITATFQHQDLNRPLGEGIPWTTGDVCLRTPIVRDGRRLDSEDPLGDPNRLGWYLGRLVGWVNCAASGTLAPQGHPFELPQFKPGSTTVGFIEGHYNLTTWDKPERRSGLVKFLPLGSDPQLLAAWQFFEQKSGDIVLEVSWGERLKSNSASAWSGLWIRLDAVPVLPPWKAPVTWGELRTILTKQDLCLDNILRPLVSQLRDGKRHVGLIGFPIPELIGSPPKQLHWQAFSLPSLSFGQNFQNGFRKRESGYWERDRIKSFGDGVKVEWLKSENWSDDELGTRGQLPDTIKSKPVFLIGAGAIGSSLAELLVRGGVRRIHILDGDLLETGNLVRHSLLLNHAGSDKAISVAARLNLISPLVSAFPVTSLFPDLRSEEISALENSKLVIDCTGSDEVGHELGKYQFNEDRWFWSISVSLGAKRVYAFSSRGRVFPYNSFNAMVTPWVIRDRSESEVRGITPIREGTGCWHSVFPATADDVALMTSVALKRLSSRISSGDGKDTLDVLEQCVANNLFSGISLVTLDASR